MRGPLAGVAALCVALGAVPAGAVSDAAGLCGAAADPCVVTGVVGLDDGAVIDLGPRALELASTGRLDFGTGIVALRARRVLLRADAQVVGPGGVLAITAAEGIHLEPQSKIDASGNPPGSVTLTAGGDAVVAGVLGAAATGQFDGGLVSVNGAAVTLAASARVLVAGGNLGAGGGVSLIAGGPLVVDAPIDARGPAAGGVVECDAARVVLNGRLDVSGGPGGAGAIVDVRARGPVVVNGTIDGDAKGSVETGGGLGAEVAVLAQGTVELNGMLLLSGGGPAGEGGILDVVAGGDVVQRGSVQARGNGAEGIGGEVRLVADGDVTAHDIDAGGGFAGNRIVLTSGRVTRLTGTLAAEPASTQGFGGVIEVLACAVDMDSVARLSTLGSEGRNALVAGGPIVLRGAVAAGAENAFVIRDAALPPVLLGPITPAPTTIVDSTLMPCSTPAPPGSTTTTTLPVVVPECADPTFSAYDALLCRLSALQLSLTEAPADRLGGKKAARRLARRAPRALRAVEQARAGRRVEKKLAAALRQVAALIVGVQRGLDRGRIDSTLGTRLLDLGTAAAGDLRALAAGAG
jgi:hypothetical protein